MHDFLPKMQTEAPNVTDFCKFSELSDKICLSISYLPNFKVTLDIEAINFPWLTEGLVPVETY